MPHTPPTDLLLAAERLYSILLFVYPPAHRREYGPLMVQAFRDLCRDAYRREGLPGLVRLWCHTLTDTAMTAAAEHIHVLKEGDQQMTRKQHRSVIISAAFPLALWLVLWLINPAFSSRMLSPTRSPAQPLGWIMAAAIPVLAGMAYLTQRMGFVVANRPDTSSWTVGRTTLRNIIFVCSILLFVVPATFLVLFGPAYLTLLDAGYSLW